jgi:hypothetical protein
MSNLLGYKTHGVRIFTKEHWNGRGLTFSFLTWHTNRGQDGLPRVFSFDVVVSAALTSQRGQTLQILPQWIKKNPRKTKLRSAFFTRTSTALVLWQQPNGVHH